MVVTELVSALKLKREQRKYKLTPDENMGALERGCFNVRRDYGLQMRNNKVTPVYSKDHSIAKTEGAWISTFLVNTCGMVTGKYDDYIIAAIELYLDVVNLFLFLLSLLSNKN